MNDRDRDEDMRRLAQCALRSMEYDNVEFGGLGLDSKRPFGNSDVVGDILEIIGATEEGDDGDEPCWSSAQREYARDLYFSLAVYMCDDVAPLLQRKR